MGGAIELPRPPADDPAADHNAAEWWRRTVLGGGGGGGGGSQRLVLLKSPHAGGYVEVVGRSEGDEYVVRVARDAYLSYRSLFVITAEAIWSVGV
eukprot:6225699-Prymnesium_polylepis.1